MPYWKTLESGIKVVYFTPSLGIILLLRDLWALYKSGLYVTFRNELLFKMKNRILFNYFKVSRPKK